MKGLQLSRSKASNTRQPKISTYFTVSKEVVSGPIVEYCPENTCHSNVIREDCDMIMNKLNKSADIKCLLKSPTQSQEIEKDKTSKPIKELFGGSQSRNDNLSKYCFKNTPNIIPQTSSDILKSVTGNICERSVKENKSEKSLKRKFHFENATCLKKKCSSNLEFKAAFQLTENTCNLKKSDSKENMSLSERKENVQVSSAQNSVCKIPQNAKFKQNQMNSMYYVGNTCTNHVHGNSGLETTTTKLNSGNLCKSDMDCFVEFQESISDTVYAFEVPNEDHISKDTKIYPVIQDLNITNIKTNNTSNLNTCNKQNSGDSAHNQKLSDLMNKSETLKQKSSLESYNINNDFDVCVKIEENTYGTEISNTNFYDGLLFDDSSSKKSLDLEGGVCCKITSVEYIHSCGEVILDITSCSATDSDTAICVLRGSWASSNLNVGDHVNVTAKPLPDQTSCWVVDNDYGLLTIHPDTLLSGTAIVGSLFCMRRSVLSDIYRDLSIDSDSQMILGSFLHELLQEVLKRKIYSKDGIKQVVNDLISSHHFIFSLYASKMSFEKTKESLCEFVPKIHSFIQNYVTPLRNDYERIDWNNGESWNGKITDIADIEENIWVPRFGMKGKVDVTVLTSTKNNKKVMPLELKTGRASFSAEHRGQVILYAMMMSELGQAVDSGLLLYLREGIMKEVKVGAVERRDLMLLRNQLVTQLKTSQKVVLVNTQQVAPPVLPPPIHHHSACAKCPYLTLCSASLRVSGLSQMSESNPLHVLSAASTEHLSMEHILYVFHWTGLLRLEYTDNQLMSPALHDIWHLPPVKRMKRGTCIPNVRLADTVVEISGRGYEHLFEWSNVADTAGATCRLREGDFLIVSSNSRPAVAAGPIRQITNNKLILCLERNLSTRHKAEQIWHLDKYESQTSLIFNTSNLGRLLDNTEQAFRLRKSVIDLELPVFSPKLSSRVLRASMDLLTILNTQQRKAILRALAADHYTLIKGMPGTGKTATIVALVQLAVRLGQSVLITSHTHSAVDNILLKLRGHVNFVRLGSAHKLHPELSDYGEPSYTFNSPEDLYDFYNSKSVVAVTCLGSSNPLLSRKQFDICVVDEATQVLQPTVFRPLLSTRKFILIGDPNQLPPLVKSPQAKELGLGQSLFARLDRPEVTTELSMQYRMNQCITDLANSLTYEGKLQCANSTVASATLTLPGQLGDQPSWVIKALSDSMDQAVMALDTGATQEVEFVNHTEASLVIQLLTALRQAKISDEQVGVIAPYQAQIEMLRKQTKALGSLVEINTVDQYQGRDKNIIIYSCTRSTKPSELDILSDKNRLTVAVTRARHKFILIGNIYLLRDYVVFNKLFNSLSKSCIISVS